MKWALLLVPGGLLLIVALECWRRHHERDHAADYVSRIQVLTPEKPLALPAVKPLQAKRVETRVERFERRIRTH